MSSTFSKNGDIMHNDKFTISTAGLPEIPKGKSETQELLKQGYRLFVIDGKWYVEKGKDRRIVSK